MSTKPHSRVCVATHPIEGPVYQTHEGILGLVRTTRPFMGWNCVEVTDDYGHLVPINFAALAASLS